MTEVAPVKVFTPCSVRLLVPILVRPPVPLLPTALAKVMSNPVVSKTAPPVPKVTVLVEGSKAAPNFRVPPWKLKAALPSLFKASACTTPWLKKRSVKAWLAVLRMRVPAPDLAKGTAVVNGVVSVSDPAELVT